MNRHAKNVSPEDSDLEAGKAGIFSTTHWSVVMEASQGDLARSAAAMEQLCRAYWYPIYAFIRRRGSNQEEAEDLTQAFFAHLLDRETLKKVDQQKGRFRAFLVAALGNFLANEWDKRRTWKRGGRLQIISLDETTAEELYGHEPVEPATPEKLFDRRWALTLVAAALARLKQEYTADDRADLFAKLEPALTGELAAGWYAESATSLGMKSGTVRVALHRLRRRFGELLRQEVAQTVASPAEVDDEIRQLFSAMSA